MAQQKAGEWVFEIALHSAFERPGAIGDVAAIFAECVEGGVCESERDVSFGEARFEASQLDFENVADLIGREWLERDDFIDAVEELRLEHGAQSNHDVGFSRVEGAFCLLQDVATDVARHDDDGVPEIDRSSF